MPQSPTSAELVQDSITVLSATEAYLVRSKITATPTERTWIYHTADAGQTWNNFQLNIVCPDPELMPSTWSFNVTCPFSFVDTIQVVNTGTAFYFLLDSQSSAGTDVWEWDGTTFTLINDESVSFFIILHLEAFKGDLYGTGINGASANENVIFKWDGTVNNWSTVLDLSTSSGLRLDANQSNMVATFTSIDPLDSLCRFTSNGSSWSVGSWDLSNVERSNPGTLITFDRSNRRAGRTFYDGTNNRYFEFISTQWLNRVIDTSSGVTTRLFFTTESDDLVWTLLPSADPATWTDDFITQNEPTQPVGNDVNTILTISNYGDTFGGQEDSGDVNLYIHNVGGDAWDSLEIVPDSFPNGEKSWIGNIGGTTYIVTQSSVTFDLDILERADTIPTI